MTPDLATFRALYPEFAPVLDASVSVYLSLALEDLTGGAWGKCFGAAVLAYAAHELALSQVRIGSAAIGAGGAVIIQQGGQIQSATAAGLSVAFVASTRAKSAAGEYLAQTIYGQQFMAKQRQCLPRGWLSW